MIVVTLRARTRRLTSLARIKDELGLDVSTYDGALTDLLDEVSSDVESFLGYRIVREGVTETRDAEGGQTLLLERTPVVHLDQVRLHSAPQSGVSVYDAAAGTVYLQRGFESTLPMIVRLTPSEGPPPGEAAWSFDYVGGWLTREDNVFASGTVTAVAGTRAFTRSSGAWPILVSGDAIAVAGFANAANNGEFTVTSRTLDTVTVLEPVVDEGPGTLTVTMKVATLPGDLERAVLDEIKDRWLRRGRDTSLTSERIGDWSGTYARPARESASGFSPGVEAALLRRRRVV